MENTHFKALEKMYLAANINRELFPSTHIKIGDGLAEISLQLSTNYFHALGATHGSVYFKMLDDAAFFAAMSRVTDYFILTTHFELDLLRPVESGVITAKGKVIDAESRQLMAMATLYNEFDKCIGKGLGTFVRSKKLLTNIGSYSN